jgi:hypothetical protein
MASIPSRHADSAQCCGANAWGLGGEGRTGGLFAPSDLAINKVYSIVLIEPAANPTYADGVKLSSFSE